MLNEEEKKAALNHGIETVRASMKLKKRKRNVRNSNKLPGQRLLIELGVPKELSVGQLAGDFDSIERVHSIAPQTCGDRNGWLKY